MSVFVEVVSNQLCKSVCYKDIERRSDRCQTVVRSFGRLDMLMDRRDGYSSVYRNSLNL